MSSIKEIIYFNSFLVKKVISRFQTNIGTTTGGATWASLPWNPIGYPYFPLDVDLNKTEYCWYVEESRIRGGYNNTQVDLGVKAYITETEDTSLRLENGLIYSGVYNSRTGLNETNVFSTGQNITKELDPRYGAIQRLYTSDTNLVIFQEDKVSMALIDKDAIYTADGNPALTASRLVLGQINQYAGEYGISDNPESFAFKGNRIYFSDKNRGAIMRLSSDGLTEISSYGMRDYFRDELSKVSEQSGSKQIILNLPPDGVIQPSLPTTTIPFYPSPFNGVEDIEYGMRVIGGQISPSGLYVTEIGAISEVDGTVPVTFSGEITSYVNYSSVTFYKPVKDKIVGSYDNYYDQYVLSINMPEEETYNTISFSENARGWTSFWDYDPMFGGTLNNTYYTVKGGSLWKHYDQSVINNRGNFYGAYYPTSVELVFNPSVSIPKNFNTVNYEGSNGWQVDFFLSDPTGYDTSTSGNNNYKDDSSFIYSYESGAYTEGGITYRAGFNRKDNKYYANLVNKGVLSSGSNIQIMPGQVVPGSSMSGIKGYFATVKVSTDNSTDLGGSKNLFAVSSNFVKS